MNNNVTALFEIAEVTDTRVVLLDADDGCTITNDAAAAIAALQKCVPGGLKQRRIYYRDTCGRFDELLVRDGRFAGFRPCTEGQQTSLRRGFDDAPGGQGNR
jgi:hypothetical protein